MDYTYDYFLKSAGYVKSKIDFTPEIGMILGTGLGGLADEIEDAVVIPYEDIPNFLLSTAPTHTGRLILGRLAGRTVACMAGRFHHYEGYDYEQLTAPIRLFKLIGVKAVVLTNAAGAVNKAYRPGDIMLIKDHLNLVGASPMRGKNVEEFGPRFFDVGDMYAKRFRKTALECAKSTPLNVHEGVYMFFVGPHFETHAEIRAASVLGADAVGMSTVTEALTAAHCALPVLGVSLMTNMAAGILDQALSGEEVDETAQRVGVPFRAYMKDVLAKLEV